MPDMNPKFSDQQARQQNNEDLQLPKQGISDPGRKFDNQVAQTNEDETDANNNDSFGDVSDFEESIKMMLIAKLL